MYNDHLTLDNSKQTGQLRDELPGSWYNYEASEITLDAQEFDHWLCRLDESMNRPAAQSQA
jgi:hypothetical protein